MGKKQPGQTTETILNEDDLLHEAVQAVDNVLDDVIGLRVGRPLLRVAKTVSPANVVHHLTKLEKPSKIIETLGDQIEGSISSKSGLPNIPSLPSPPKMF